MAKIGFIGMGNMGGAILGGLLKFNAPETMIFTDALEEKLQSVTAKTGVPHTASNRECAGQAKYLILAVKLSTLTLCLQTSGMCLHGSRLLSHWRPAFP